MRVVAWGTYDTGKPRVRILLKGLQLNGVEVIECHRDVWGDVEDKSQIKGVSQKLTRLIKWIISYPKLIWSYCNLPKHDAVLICYMGQLDILIICLFARLRGTPIVWDGFLSLYNTVVEDRKLVSRYNPLAWGLYCWEWLACKAADIIILDTKAHGDYFTSKFNLPDGKVKSVFVGAEPESFPPVKSNDSLKVATPSILFYGQFIPLHGIETIIQAARLAKNDNLSWTVIGTGQEKDKIQKLIDDEPLPQLNWIPWIEYKNLIKKIHDADICLGIFGKTEKAARVIPNKVFQLITAGMPIITMDSPAIRELVPFNQSGVKLSLPGDPVSLYNKINELLEELDKMEMPLHRNLVEEIEPKKLGKDLAIIIGEAAL
ncbi:glycosyltransferase [Paraglaciecola sp.]|uniref:glycosyltransferase n=1 Tax=Paraglaciecola sp. TaxID=1920173 RepID=UPI00273F32D6|nr:glycosyltransferase [Paraglaciecola sp.]MDP5029819.1 glycosyltransferase [Paraglaciecola sp.]